MGEVPAPVILGGPRRVFKEPRSNFIKFLAMKLTTRMLEHCC